jgi:hypothetical protein
MIVFYVFAAVAVVAAVAWSWYQVYEWFHALSEGE